ncbi:MAG: hypothetical protein ABMA64_42715, partial [Myxococcota bacterium]
MLRSFYSCIVLALSSAASAADAPDRVRTIGVTGIHQDKLDAAAQQRAIEGLIATIEQNGAFDALSPADLVSRLAGRESVVLEEGLLALPAEKLASGKNAYNQASWDDAISYLTDAIDSFRDAFQGANDANQLWEAWVYLGSCQLMKDAPDPAAARTAFAAAIALSPIKPLNPAQFPPDVVDAYTALQAELTAQRVSVQVVSSDATANVWLDGTARGTTPAAVPDVVPGEHHVVARAPSGQGYVRIDVAPPELGSVLSVNVPLGPPSLATAAASGAGRSSQIGAVYRSLGKRTDGVDYLLLVGVSDAVLYVQLLNVANDTWSKAIELPYADLADDEAIQALPLLLKGVTADGSFSSLAPAPGPLDIGGNGELARLLTGGVAPAVDLSAGPVEPPKKSKVGLVLGIVGGVLLAGGAGVGTYYYTSL